MDEDRYKALMDAITNSKQEVEGKLTELRKEVTQAQQQTSQELASKFNKSSYQFRKKGNKVQFHLNNTLGESISAVKKELSQLADSFATTSSEAQKASLKRTANHLDEGIKAITKRQKHIKVADRSDYSWATVQAYDTDDLASGSDDEKDLRKQKKWLKEELLRSAKPVVVTVSVRPATGVMVLVRATRRITLST